MTFDQIADVLEALEGVRLTRQRIEQLHQLALRKLRSELLRDSELIREIREMGYDVKDTNEST